MDKVPSPVEHLSHLWRRNVAAFAPTTERCRFPGKRCRFEESTSLLIVETGLSSCVQTLCAPRDSHEKEDLNTGQLVSWL